MKSSCLFCDIQRSDRKRILAENELSYAILDGFPVTKDHTLVIPKRHADTFFELTEAEVLACNQLLLQRRRAILLGDGSVQGFNIGMNAGAVAGQTVFHCHIHLIPRRAGDVENPRGGVRHVIPGKGFYKAE
jgi:ATP adenylyltransferase